MVDADEILREPQMSRGNIRTAHQEGFLLSKALKLDGSCLFKHDNETMDAEKDEKRVAFKDA